MSLTRKYALFSKQLLYTIQFHEARCKFFNGNMILRDKRTKTGMTGNLSIFDTCCAPLSEGSASARNNNEDHHLALFLITLPFPFPEPRRVRHPRPRRAVPVVVRGLKDGVPEGAAAPGQGAGGGQARAQQGAAQEVGRRARRPAQEGTGKDHTCMRLGACRLWYIHFSASS